jgi:FkbH-like protein
MTRLDETMQGTVKCVVWDLDNTLWDGTLLEGDPCDVPPEVHRAIRTLDERGILQSVASKNDPDIAQERLAEVGLADMFLYPQIGWKPKSESIKEIAASLNFGLDALAFVDDQPFERAEVAHAHPQVVCVDPVELAAILETPAFVPRFVTTESARRRDLYRIQASREAEEHDFQGTNEEFLRTLGMRFTIRRAGPGDLQRAEELTVRTNQLNSTGRTYSFAELDELRSDPAHWLLVAEMSDRFGDYGTIGLALVHRDPEAWHLKLMLMSCRTMSRGVGTILLSHIMRTAAGEVPRLRADFVETGRNRMMQITYAFAGFREVARDGDHVTLESDLAQIQSFPDYVDVVT